MSDPTDCAAIFAGALRAADWLKRSKDGGAKGETLIIDDN